MRSIFTIIALTALTSACGWPQYGQGGMDEVYEYRRAEITPGISIDEAVYEHLANRLDSAKAALDHHKSGAGRIFRPALVQAIDDQWGRAARTLKGMMLADAKIDIEHLDILLTRLSTELLNLRNVKFDQPSETPTTPNTNQNRDITG